jgi:transposase
MNYYKGKHKHVCGIDLHSRKMYLCIVDEEGSKVLHKNFDANPEAFLKAVGPYREDLIVAVECMFCWYWLADLCAEEGIHFLLGHALYMTAIHGGKSKNDRLDSEKIAMLARGGMFPQAYVYPKAYRATRDLLRRRMHMTRKRAELLSHIKNTNAQYNLPKFDKAISYRKNRSEMEEHFSSMDDSLQLSMKLNCNLINSYDDLLRETELHLTHHAKAHEPQAYYLLRSIPGVGEILSLAILYEIETIKRFSNVGKFLSYSRLVKPRKDSDGKKVGYGGSKLGNRYLKWAFGEAAVLMLRQVPQARVYKQSLEQRYGKAKALSILAQRLGRTVYGMLKNNYAFNLNKFLPAEYL